MSASRKRRSFEEGHSRKACWPAASEAKEAPIAEALRV